MTERAPEPYCGCCGNSVGCDCYSKQSAQKRRIAELEAQAAALRAALETVQLIVEADHNDALADVKEWATDALAAIGVD